MTFVYRDICVQAWCDSCVKQVRTVVYRISETFVYKRGVTVV